MIKKNEITFVSRTCFRHYDILTRTRSKMTAISFSRQNDTGSRARTLCLLEKLVAVLIVILSYLIIVLSWSYNLKVSNCKAAKTFMYIASRSNISKSRDIVFPHISNTEKRVENKTRSGVFLTNFEVFDIAMKHCDECLI